ncbi:DUF4209 domain-containing protein [Listeria monocytogenes]|uniref:DUF4209 domain-containing protein n=1 Tax=Listeria monocytogenes TaxID=1639 RepID=UPI001F0F67E0|nr:DUF4209 domain-containing protein [Listeria monocytogenes]MCH5002080.1 DUF4209 domain-containing protein [Listeria monocytogenes]MCH5012136.1 DUF4209 domain-containing protein [Listeria monocytogenes]MCH5025555.1 DUF4209 domain-containing protein [Listeria monocytogenes]MCH5056807.1 DUF4209 domain-containing protein [Listeria monocytogenes]MCH5060247.1 DUF4209 domain-containing protein [Listeria monocytogenes]
MTIKLIDYIFEGNETLYFELVALEVYEDIATKIVEDNNEDDFQAKRKKLYEELEKRFDSSEDDFVRLVIAYSFISGTYFMINGLSTTGKLDKYSGKRYTEFVTTITNNAIEIAQTLIKNEIQYRFATDLIGIALKVANKQTKNDIANKVNEFVKQTILSKDEAELSVKKVHFLIPAINLLLEYKEFRNTSLLLKIDEMLGFAIEQGDTAASERSKCNSMGFDCLFPGVFELKIQYCQKSNNTDKEKINEVVRSFADTYVNLAKSRRDIGEVNLQMAIQHYENAVKIYVKYGFNDELKVVKKLLDEAKQELENWNNPHSISREYNLMDYFPKEYHEQLNEWLKVFEKLDINNKIQTLLSNNQLVPLISKSDVSKFRNRRKQSNQFSEIFPVNIVNEKGHTIFYGDSEECKESYALYNYIQIFSVPLWSHFLTNIFEQQVQLDFTELFSSIGSLSKRSHLFSKAYELFFSGDIYSALYILVPQVEWWFREIAYQAGEQTSNLNYFPTEHAKTLAPIFATDALKKYLGEEQHWLFEQLMTKEPMNIRNKIAHGLDLNDNGFCVYYALCVFKLVIREGGIESEDV